MAYVLEDVNKTFCHAFVQMTGYFSVSLARRLRLDFLSPLPGLTFCHEHLRVRRGEPA